MCTMCVALCTLSDDSAKSKGKRVDEYDLFKLFTSRSTSNSESVYTQYRYSRSFLEKNKCLISYIWRGRIHFNNSVIFEKWNIGCRSVGISVNGTRRDRNICIGRCLLIVILSPVLTITEKLSRLPVAQSFNCGPCIVCTSKMTRGENISF